ncbi:MAG: M20 metallopeptidase family protein [Chitinispirillaceae bacterium]
MSNPTDIRERLPELIEKVYPRIVEIRRTIHQNPELSGQEYETAKFVYSTLASWGFRPQYHLKKTAVSLRQVNGRGPTVVLRADMDALPLQEENRVPYASAKKGVMHACGHDMHTAILLGAVKVLGELRDSWKGTLVFLFQPSEEEEPGGAYGLIKSGAFPKDANAVFGLHVSADHKTGTVGVKEGYDYAGVLTFDVTVKGRGGHGATPETSVDPIVCASAMIMQLQTIVSREKPSFEPAVLTVGFIQSGTLRNIIPDTAVFKGTLRTHSEELQNFFQKRIRDALKQTALSYRASADITFEKSYPPGFNNPDLTRRSEEVFRDYFGGGNVVRRSVPSMYAEDFARYQQLVPGLYIYLGVRPPGKKKMEGIHSPRFLPDETAIKTGIASHVLFAGEVMGGQG